MPLSTNVDPIPQTVNVVEKDIKESLHLPVRAHVRVRGIEKLHPRVISRDLEAIKRSRTIFDITNNMNEAKSRWVRLGIFNDVKFNLEPTFDGAPDDVCVHIDVVESKAKKTFGVYTTETILPELTLSLENIFGGRYSFSGSYAPPTSRLHAVSFSMHSNVPFLGQRGEYFVGRRIENKVYHPATSEKIEELKAVTKNEKQNISSELSIGFQRRILASIDKHELSEDFAKDFKTTFKGFITHDFGFSNVMYHADPYLCNMYPLPIQGSQLNLKNEIAGGILGGEFNFLKSEVQTAKYWPLGPFCSLQWNAKLAGIWSYNRTRIPLNDRLFLSSSHIRGFKSVGPSTIDGGVKRGGRFAATGGNALWATSVSLNFPFLLFPDNGLMAMHLFANIGNLKMLHDSSELFNVYHWLRTCAASFGFGIVVTRIPLLGIAPNGRFELNFSIPFCFDERGNVNYRSHNKNLFDHVKFGLTWSSAFSM
ncbi:putative Surface antigen [Trypanosoma vivax]|nr:hypothetical protein TRVL_06105 [Trypanosoma vivax]KAH8605589.1 putative Surface antigen [Trypanosoma vivax]